MLEPLDTPFVLVDSYPEALLVYKYSSKKVLVIGECLPSQYHWFDYSRTEFVVYNESTLKILSKKKAKIHVFLNTGMNREGIQDIESFLLKNKSLLEKVQVTGVCSHLASADTLSSLTALQTEVFFEGVEILKRYGFYPHWVHLGNSAGIFTLQDSRFTAFRVGLSLYGCHTLAPDVLGHDEAEENLQPILEVESQVVSVQEILPQEKVSYNETYTASEKEIIGVVPFGYSEGLFRSLSNTGIFFSGEKKRKIAGRVCMNLTCVTGDDIKLSEKIEILSKNSSQENSAQEIAKQIGTVPYEIFTRLNASIRREIVWK
jgi:alanine racemase